MTVFQRPSATTIVFYVTLAVLAGTILVAAAVY
jgi:hypothetical protein